MKEIRKIIREQVEKEVLQEKNFFSNIIDKLKGDNKSDGDFYKIGNNTVEKLEILDIPSSSYKNYLNNNIDNLSWLFSANFYAQSIVIDSKKNKVIKFVGIWNEGDFRGENFSSVVFPGGVDWEKIGFNDGNFYGGIFNVNYQFWKTSPINFISGTVGSKFKEDGILGLSNLENGKVNELQMIQIPVGKALIIKQEGDTNLYSIEMKKRLDDVSADFILNGNNTSNVTLKWSDIRKMYNNWFVIRVGKKGLKIPGVISLNGTIQSLEVVDSGDDILKKTIKKIKSPIFSINTNKLSDVFSKNIEIKNADIKEKFGDNKNAQNFLLNLRRDFSSGGNGFKKHIDALVEFINFNDSLPSFSGYKFINKMLSNKFLNEFKDVSESSIKKDLDYINNFLSILYFLSPDKDLFSNELYEYINKNITKEAKSKIKFGKDFPVTDPKTGVSGVLDPTGKLK